MFDFKTVPMTRQTGDQVTGQIPKFLSQTVLFIFLSNFILKDPTMYMW
jgi:hypothetical protein